MLAATITLAVIAGLQLLLYIVLARLASQQTKAAKEQAEAARRQAEAADRQVEVANRQVAVAEKAIEVTERQLQATRELEERASRPLLSIAVSMRQGDSLTLKIRNEGAGPALRIAVGRHQPNSNELDKTTLVALSRLTLLVGDELTIKASERSLESTPLFVHCWSAQGREQIYRVKMESTTGRLSVTQFSKEMTEADMDG